VHCCCAAADTQGHGCMRVACTMAADAVDAVQRLKSIHNKGRAQNKLQCTHFGCGRNALERATAAAVALTDTPLARCLAIPCTAVSPAVPATCRSGSSVTEASTAQMNTGQQTAGVTVCSQVSCCRSRQPTRHNTSGCAACWVLVVAEHLPAAEETGEEAHLR
jgi:hypothetical protein